MAILTSEKTEKGAIMMGGSMMALSARTAPKTRGLDSVKTVILTDGDLERLAVAMEKKVHEKSTLLPIFKRDADNVRSSAAVLLIGVSRDPKRMDSRLIAGDAATKPAKTFWRVENERGEDFTGPICVFQAIDLGIALGSAVKMAGELNIDNRIMYTVGAAAKKLRLLDSDIIIGIPLSAEREKSIF